MQGQGQGNSCNSFPGNFYFNDGLGSDQHNMVPDALANDGHASMRWIGQSSSSLDNQNHVGFGQFIADDFWLSPLGDQASTNQRFEERHSNDPNFNPFLQNISMNPSTFNPFLESPVNGHISSEHGPIDPSSFLPGQEASSGPLQHNLDMNAVVHEGSGIDASQDNGPYLSLDLFRAGTAAGDHIPTSGGSSSPVMIYSGIAGYVLEENINREGLPTEGQRRLLCKRRAPEFASGHVTSGDSSSSTWQVENSEQSGVTAQDNVIGCLNASSSLNNGLNSSHSEGILAALPAPSNFYQNPNEAGQVENFQRNTRLRRTASQQNPTPLNLWTWNSSNSNVQATGQPSVFSPFDRFTITNSAPAPVLVNPVMQPIIQISNWLQAPQPSQYWNGTTMSWIGSSSTSPSQTINIREALGQEENFRNNRRNMMIPLANIQANPNLANVNANFVGNIASSSRIQSGSGMYLPTSSMRSPQPNMAEQYAQRVRNIVDCPEAWRQGNYCPIHSAAAPAVRDMDVSVRGANARPALVPLRLGQRAERHSEVLPTVLSQTASQRRSRLVSEVRNALGLVRRPGGLRLEDVMVIDPSFLYGMPEMPDIHDDMRLDVDNMSYEELLNLEEQIGNVCTGISEESILANLRRRQYQSITIGPPVEAEPCCICQEDYANGEELGQLDCGHDFHFNCIKQWLVQKNSCPICKKIALAI